jgi:hypothetical protein
MYVVCFTCRRITSDSESPTPSPSMPLSGKDSQTKIKRVREKERMSACVCMLPTTPVDHHTSSSINISPKHCLQGVFKGMRVESENGPAATHTITKGSLKGLQV